MKKCPTTLCPLRLVMALFVLGLAACAQPLRSMPRPFAGFDLAVPVEAIAAQDWARLLMDSKTSTSAATPAVGSPASLPRVMPSDVILSAPLDGHVSWRLVWLKTRRTPGRATGPLALVFVGPSRIDVLAMGQMSLPEGDVFLQYADMHEFFAVRAEVTQCQAGTGGRPQMCHTTMRLLPNINHTLVGGSEVRHEIALRATYALSDAGRVWTRQIDSHAEVELCQGTIILTESASLKEYHRKRLNLPPRQVRQVQGVRSLRWELGSWHASNAPLWQMMAQAESFKQR